MKKQVVFLRSSSLTAVVFAVHFINTDTILYQYSQNVCSVIVSSFVQWRPLPFVYRVDICSSQDLYTLTKLFQLTFPPAVTTYTVQRKLSSINKVSLV
jgi:hypothetical protein